MKTTAGSLFVRFIVIGLLSLIILIPIIKHGNLGSDASSLLLVCLIFIINFLVVFGYTIAVLRVDDILLEEEAADLAYYLGFCLTVASLAISFISDMSLATSSNGNSKLIRGSLAQFGAGLMATLIGLIAKIYITSKQNHIARNPETLYTEFCKKIKDFENSLNFLSSTLKSTINTVCDSISQSATLAADSMQRISERLEVSANLISSNLSAEKITMPITTFSESLQNLHQPVRDFKAELSNVREGAASNTSTFNELNSSLLNLKRSVIEETIIIDNLTDAKNRLIGVNQNTIELLDIQNQSISESTKQFTKLRNNSIKTSENLESLSEESISLIERSRELTQGLLSITSALRNSSEVFAELNAQAINFDSSVNSVNLRMTDFSNRTDSVQSAFVEASNALAEVNSKLHEISSSFGQSNESFNLFINSFASAVTSSQSFAQVLLSANEPIKLTSESIGSLKTVIDNLKSSAEDLSQIVSRFN